MSRQRSTQMRTTESVVRRRATQPTPSVNRSHPILQLQRAVGNRAVQCLIARQCNSAVGILGNEQEGYFGVSVADIVNGGLRSPSQSLDAETRAFMEARFGYDFSAVRVHTNSEAAESSQAIDANAYTIGQDIVFGEGEYRPATSEGQRLLAHELTHIIQQSASTATYGFPVAGELSVSDPEDVAEVDAEATANKVMAGSSVAQSSVPCASVHRDDSGSDDQDGILDTIKDVFTAGHAGLEGAGVAAEGEEALQTLPGGLAAGLSPVQIAVGASDLYSSITSDQSNLVNTAKGVQGAADVVGGASSLASLAGVEAIPGVGEVAGALAGGMAIGNLIEKETGIGSKAGDLAFDVLGPKPGLWLADHLPSWLQ